MWMILCGKARHSASVGVCAAFAKAEVQKKLSEEAKKACSLLHATSIFWK
jgi:hypothetical protein